MTSRHRQDPEACLLRAFVLLQPGCSLGTPRSDRSSQQPGFEGYLALGGAAWEKGRDSLGNLVSVGEGAFAHEMWN